MSESEFCAAHREAMKNLENGYERWRRAFGTDMTRREYFAHLLPLEETGTAVKKLIAYMQRKQPEAT